MGPDVTYIHCTGLDEDAWRRIAATGGHVSIACPIEMEMGHGVPPVLESLAHGIRPSLRVDVETQMPGEMFTQMRAMFTLQRMLALARAREGGGAAPRLLTAREVIEFATVAGARANGLESRIGTLTPGKEADIVLLRRDAINVLPFNNAYGAVVQAMDTSNVDTVLVAVRIVKRDGQLTGVDIPRVRQAAEAARDGILSRAGWSRSVLGRDRQGH
jgi:cytosine/adenosine deaminase-related metal-dependent hydrolase